MRAVLILLALAGCAQIDPYRREGMWQPEGANSRNLAAMVANPADLLRGHGEAGAQPVLAANAVSRLLAGTPRPLPALNAETAPSAVASSAGIGPVSATPVAGAN